MVLATLYLSRLYTEDFEFSALLWNNELFTSRASTAMFRVAYFLFFLFVLLLFMGAVFKPLVIDSNIPSLYKGLLAAALTALIAYVIKRIVKLENPNLSKVLSKVIPTSDASIANMYWETALDEVNNGTQSKALWAKCIAVSNGENEAAKSIYIRRRAEELQKEATASSESSFQISTLNPITRQLQKFELTDEMKLIVDELVRMGCTIEIAEDSLMVITPKGKKIEGVQNIFELESLLIDLTN
jgi:hypothetical protein